MPRSSGCISGLRAGSQPAYPSPTGTGGQAVALTQFTRNYTDRSSDKGYQFEFYCDKCGTGLRSSFQANKLGVAAGLLRAASSLFGGALGGAAQSADYVKDALRGEGWDSAFKSAIDEAKPRFRQCTRCGKWVCPEVCWNESRTLCKVCAPELAEEGAVLQARLEAEQLGQKMRAPEPAVQADAPGRAHATCPHCSVAVDAAAKFCPECGKSLAVAPACGKCGAKFTGAGKFCPECGEARRAI
jgi:Double zinc ribbon/Prokaryotic RING finger family 2